MNVQEPLFPAHKTRAAATSPTPSMNSTSNNTAADNIETSEPSQHYWTMSQYLEISLPLTTAIIILPMIAGPLFRFASQQYEAHRRQWHLFLVVFGACYFIYVIVAGFLDVGWMPFVHFVTAYPVSGVIGVLCTWRAYKKKEGRLRWSLQLLSFLMFLFLDIFALYFLGLPEVPWSAGPFLYILLTSKMGVRCFRRIWTWLSWKNKRQSGAESLLGTTV